MIIPAPLPRYTADHRLLHGLGRTSIIHNDDAADIIIDGSSIDTLHGLPCARPLHKHLALLADSATHEHSHNLTWWRLLSIHPAAFPLYEHFVNAGALATANYKAIPAVHCNTSQHSCTQIFYPQSHASSHIRAYLPSSTPAASSHNRDTH